mmetsp:Transcript_69242/g.144339  ORF Transcript_69242/g.144339 Transcript_69242/m.144339 type:complete len:252 (+) Transcript_69242:117-872(+)
MCQARRLSSGSPVSSSKSSRRSRRRVRCMPSCTTPSTAGGSTSRCRTAWTRSRTARASTSTSGATSGAGGAAASPRCSPSPLSARAPARPSRCCSAPRRATSSRLPTTSRATWPSSCRRITRSTPSSTRSTMPRGPSPSCNQSPRPVPPVSQPSGARTPPGSSTFAMSRRARRFLPSPTSGGCAASTRLRRSSAGPTPRTRRTTGASRCGTRSTRRARWRCSTAKTTTGPRCLSCRSLASPAAWLRTRSRT